MKKVFFLLLSFLIIGCSEDVSSNVNTSSSSVNEVSTSSTTLNYDDLSFVFSNSTNYALRNPNANVEYYFEISNEDMYFNVYDAYGYIILEEDEDFLHSFSLKSLSSETYDVMMEVYGRNSTKDSLKDIKKENFLSYFYKYIDAFSKEDKYLWKLDSQTLCNELSNFFQLKSLKYCNNIEITVNEKGKIDQVKIYEGEGLILSAVLEYKDTKEFSMYKKWYNEGRKIQERIIDYKMLYEYNNTIISVYNRKEIDITATIVAIDHENNYYVANEDKKEGNIGIKVVPIEDYNFNLGDIVEVRGKIDTNNLNVSIVNAEILDTGNDATYLPIFDEEMVVDTYGGGIYANQFFASYPFYNDSVYTTYSYVKDIPSSLSEVGDTIIKLRFAKFENFECEVIIPKEMALENKANLFNTFLEAGLYGEENALELCLDNFVIQYNSKGTCRIKLLATEASLVYKKLNGQEKIEKINGLINFPGIEDASEVSYRFGGSTGAYLEEMYGIETNNTQGVFLGYSNISSNEVVLSYLKTMENYAVKYDEIKDVYKARHYIYNKQDAIIDIQYIPIDRYTDTATLYIWVYNSKLIQCPPIEETLERLIGNYFNVDNFLKLSGTYDADYTAFELYGYADNLYSKEDPLICVTIDTQEKIFDDYNKALIQMGYKQYRNENNKPYTYKTRGQNHYIFEKDGVYLDVATYHTSDYTYYKHEEYEYRLEILIYKNDKILEVNKYDNLSPLIDLYKDINEELEYTPTLPSDAEVEVWLCLGNYTMWKVEYGYGHSDQAFIYTNEVDNAFNALKDSLIDAGYTNSSNSLNSSSFKKVIDGEVYYVFILKESEKGYVRIFHDVGGVDFIR